MVAFFKNKKRAKIRYRYNQVPHLTQDINVRVTISQLNHIKIRDGGLRNRKDNFNSKRKLYERFLLIFCCGSFLFVLSMTFFVCVCNHYSVTFDFFLTCFLGKELLTSFIAFA